MNKKFLSVVFVSFTLASSAVLAADSPPSEASIKRLLEVSRVRKVIDETTVHIDTLVTRNMAQVTRGQTLSPKMEKEIEQAREDSKGLVKEMLNWSKLEPVYLRIYQKSLTQPEVDSLIEMYQTPGGRALLSKMPSVMQDSMAELQQLMQPLLERIQRKQQEISAKIQAEKKDS